jgi:hypothetical protein
MSILVIIVVQIGGRMCFISFVSFFLDCVSFFPYVSLKWGSLWRTEMPEVDKSTVVVGTQ